MSFLKKNNFRTSILFIILLSILVGLNAHSFAETPEDLSKLIDGAKKEGELTLYSSGAAGQAQLLLDRFTKIYPFIKVGYYRTGKVALLTRILSEDRFKRYVADVIQTSAIQTNILKKKGVLETYFPPEGRLLPKESRDPEGYWHANYISSIVCGYNTRLVSPSEVPKTYEDLLNPKWKGMIEIETNKIEWFATLLKLKGERFFEKLSQQKPSVRAGDPISRNLLAAGEFNILADTYLYAAEKIKGEGAPTDWVGLEPVVIYFSAISLPAHAPHPNAAKLFVNYILSKDGQKILNQWGRIPIRSDVGSTYKKLLDKHKTIIADLELGEKEKEIHELIDKYFR